MKLNRYSLTTVCSICLGLALLFFSNTVSAQDGVRIAASAGTADPSALLDVVSTSKGVLIPRMTSGQRTSISSPATGLLVYQTDGTPGFYYNAGTPGSPNWIILSAGALSGVGTANSVARWTTSSALGTGVITDNGSNVGIGIASPGVKLDVAGTIRANGGTLVSEVSSNEGGSLSLRNPSKTGSSSGEWILYNMTGGYGNSFQIWEYPTNSSPGCCIPRLKLNDDGNTILSPSGGNVGIGVASPSEKLDIDGKLRFAPNGSTMSRAPRVLHTEDTRGGCPGAYAVGTDLIAHTFTVSSTASVYLSGQIIRNVAGRADLILMLNGGQVDQSLSWTSSAQWDDMNVQWSGVIGPGTYTVSIRGNTANIWGCGPSWGSIDSIIFEH